MNIYKISQTVNDDWDTYDSAVVAAENEEEAKKINPDKYAEEEWWNDNYKLGYYRLGYTSGSWCFTLEQVKVELIGVAKEGTKKGVIVASFNAG